MDVPGFIAAQLAGGASATLLFRWLIPPVPAADATENTCGDLAPPGTLAPVDLHVRQD
jgi:hypothetical protein